MPLRVADDWEERWIVIEEIAEILNVDVKDIRNGRDGSLDRLADDWDTLDVDGDGWDAGFPDPEFLGALRAHRIVYGYTLRAELVYQLLCELRADPAMVPSSSDVLVIDEYQDLTAATLRRSGCSPHA
jgi:DNA helicase-2/ATP-dependent DNA helicase PcrA